MNIFTDLTDFLCINYIKGTGAIHGDIDKYLVHFSFNFKK